MTAERTGTGTKASRPVSGRRLDAATRMLPALLVLLVAWQAVVSIGGVAPWILPAPWQVLQALFEHRHALAGHAVVTGAEIVAGLVLGVTLGVGSAVLLCVVHGARRWALPLMVISQAVPVFALAPVLTLWLGYGPGAKVAMATLIIYFPVVAASVDGLRHTDPAMLDLARTLGASRRAELWHLRLPAALPSIGSGIRVAASVAPIGAVVGEWTGSSAGLGHAMLQANARLQTDLMFAALACLCALAIALYAAVDRCLDRALYWQGDHLHLSSTPDPRATPATTDELPTR